ncbi:tryptophan synthase subunit alpha [candidate division KSB1 bacterium]
MNRITEKIQYLKRKGKKAFIPFITAGYPDINSTPEVFAVLERSGADIIEIGMPFSDPLADGPTIQYSSDCAIKNGATPSRVFETIKTIRSFSEVPILLFAYTNLILNFGIDEFMEQLSCSGGDGLLVPDLPVEESGPFYSRAKKHTIRMIFLISPLTSQERMREIERRSDDFVYCVSIAGVTGAREQLFKKINSYLKTVRSVLTKPFVVGFGVSNGGDARKIAELSDGVVVGSALIKRMQHFNNKQDLYKNIHDFAMEIKNGIE